MFKKRFVTVLIVISLLALVPAVAIAKGRPPEPGGGGHTEPAGNNLSFPVIFSGGALSLPGSQDSVSLMVPYPFVASAEVPDYYCPDDTDPETNWLIYAQKTVGNVWQAENATYNTLGTPELDVFVDEIDWGDSLESIDMKVGRPVRVELSLYKHLDTTMTGYSMYMFANPSSPDEVQGVCTESLTINDIEKIKSYDSFEATVYDPEAKLIIQKIDDVAPPNTPILTWSPDDGQWTGDVGLPLYPSFSGELNVGGKVIYGLSTGGWSPTETGVYRITFYLPPGGNTLFWEDEIGGGTVIRISAEEESVAVAEEGVDIGGGEAFIDVENNLTYIDVTVVGGGGGGGGGKP